MRLKYFLRGAGTGVIVTAILFMVLLTALDWGPRSTSRLSEAQQAEDGTDKLVGEDGKDYLEAEKKKAEKSAEENKEDKKAEESAGENKEDKKAQETDQSAGESTKADSEKADSEKAENKSATDDNKADTKTDAKTTDSKTTDSKTSDTKVADTKNTDTKNDNTKPALTKTVSFSIKDGEGSDGIAVNLKTIGLVDDAKKFNDYLAANGYDRRLRTGNFKVPMGLSYKDLAELLSKKPE